MSKRLIAVITVIAMIFSVMSIGVFANAETEGLYTYVENEDGTVTITSCKYTARNTVTVPTTLGGKTVAAIADRAFFECMDIEAVVIPDGIKTIGEEAFRGCMSMASVAISPTVEYIGEGAFADCTSLNSITITGPGSTYQIIDDILYTDEGKTLHTFPAGFLRSFSGIASKNEISVLEEEGDIGSVDDIIVITTYEIPYGVEKIASKAFYSNVGLTSITIPETVKEIGDGAFACAFALEDIFVNANNQNFTSHERVLYTADKTELVACPQSLSEMDFAISESTTKIRPYAFAGCSMLEYIALNEGISLIGDYAFFNCGLLYEITIPYTVDDVGVGCFKSCTSLSEIELSVWMTRLADYLFEGCVNLKSVQLMDSIETIGKGVFKGCSSLTSVEGNDFFASQDGVLYTADKTELIIYPAAKEEAEFNVPDTVTEIRDHAFYQLGMNLSQIVVPSSVKTIGEYAFAYSESLMGIEFQGAVPESFAQTALESMGALTIYYYTNNAQSFAPNGETQFRGYELVCLDADEFMTPGPAETPSQEPEETPTQEPETTPRQQPEETPPVTKDIIKEESGYTVTDDGYITNVEPQTALVDFHANLGDGVDAIIKNANGEIVEDNTEIICTGYTVSVMDENGNEAYIYTLSVEGDLNGDGKANSRDIAAMQKHIIGTEILDTPKQYAADLREDGAVNSRDIAALQKKISA